MFHWLTHALLDDATYQAARRVYTDKSDGEPILTEEALIHAKSEHCGCHIIHFYIAARDTVVNCGVPEEVWYRLEKGQRGILCHQGGSFYSFEYNGELICEDTTPPKLSL